MYRGTVIMMTGVVLAAVSAFFAFIVTSSDIVAMRPLFIVLMAGGIITVWLGDHVLYCELCEELETEHEITKNMLRIVRVMKGHEA